MSVTYSGYKYLDNNNWDNSGSSPFYTIQLEVSANLVVNTGVSGLASVIPIGSDDPSLKATEITVGAMGGLFGESWGLALGEKGNVRIRNDGVIHGEVDGVGNYDLFGALHGTFTSLINNGIISSGTFSENSSAIRTSAIASESTSIVNTGKIVSGFEEDGFAIHHTGNSSDRVVNTGIIIGVVDLGVGNDLYDGRKGTLAGVIYGGDGNDIIRTGSDDDHINGGLGADTLDGGAGDDTYSLTDDISDTIRDTSGEDTITSAIGRDLADYKGIENITITSFGKGNATGNDGDNKLIGGYSANTLSGGAGDDILSGSKGRDTLFGDTGKDVLNGGADADLLSGGAGKDRFVFNQLDGKLTSNLVDKITDWSIEDSIDTKIAGTASNYAELAVAAGIDTIEEAVTVAKASITDKDIAHLFLFNSSKDIGFLLMDLDNNDTFETGVILSKSGAAADFSYADLI